MSICHSNSYRGNSITGTVSIYHSTPVSVTRSARRNCVRTSHCKSYKYWQYYMHHDLRSSQVVHSKRGIKECAWIRESPKTYLGSPREVGKPDFDLQFQPPRAKHRRV